MGTLTADCPRLAEQCLHKLPSSCRLTSTPLCCACADIRPHSTTYRVYIDGVGYVNRGTRWQSYCWFCKSFWDARVAAAGLLPPASRIPEDPDQAEFIDRWFEWHQGYRLMKHENGRIERINLVGQPLSDADPGFLPLSAEELGQGQRTTLESDERRRARLDEVSTPIEAHVSLEDELDRLMADTDDEDLINDRPEAAVDGHAAGTSTEYSNENAQSTMEARTRLDEAYAAAQTAVEAAQRVRDRAEARLENATTELSILRERLRRIHRQQVTLGNFARVFGSREDVDRDDYVSPITNMFQRHVQWARMSTEERAANRSEQNGHPPQGRREAQHQEGQARGDGNASNMQQRTSQPISSRRAPSGQRSAAQDRATEQRSNPSRSSSATGMSQEEVQLSNSLLLSLQSIRSSRTSAMPNDTNSSRAGPDPATMPRSLADNRLDEDQSGSTAPTSEYATGLSPLNAQRILRLLDVALQPIQDRLESAATSTDSTAAQDYESSHPAQPSTSSQQEVTYGGLDADARPSIPKTDAEMTVKAECKICLQQTAEIACLPCGHLSMCGWCADQWIPTKEADHTRPTSKGIRCPCCRKGVKSRVRIFVG